jgi:hypothetical protein
MPYEDYAVKCILDVVQEQRVAPTLAGGPSESHAIGKARHGEKEES